MSKRVDQGLEELCLIDVAKKVDNIDQQLHVISDNHLPHIYERLETVDGTIKEMKEKWNWKMWAGVAGVGISFLSLMIAFVELFL